MAGVKIKFLGDETALLRSIANVQGKMGSFTGQLAGMGTKGGGAFKGLAGSMAASGLLGQFGELQQMLSSVSGSLNQMGEKGKTSAGKIVAGVGVGAAALGGIGLMASKPLQDANAQLKQSIENQGGSWDDFAGKIGSADKKMERLGHTNADTNAALSTLTQAFNDPEKALAQLNLTSDIAARNHTSLAEAAGTVIKVHAGSTRALKAFGINVKDTTDLGKAATTAQKEQTKAHETLTAAQLRQSNLQARLKASGGTSDAANTKKIAAAQDALAKAGLHLQTVQASITGGHKKGASAAAELQAAQTGVTSASKKLDDAQAATTKTGKLSVAQQQELTKANKDVADAQAAVSKTDKTALATKGDLDKGTVTEAVALQMLTDKTHGLAAAQADTFGGKLRTIKADISDFAATTGAKYGGMLITAGPALAGIGGLMQTHIIEKSASAIGAVGRFGGSLLTNAADVASWGVKVAWSGAKILAAWILDMTGMSAAAEASAVATETAWAPVLATGGVFLVGIAAVGGAAYLMATHWAETWKGMKAVAQGAINAIDDLIGWLLDGFNGIMRGMATMAEAATHLPLVGGQYVGLAESLRSGQQDLASAAATLHKGIDITATAAVKAAAAVKTVVPAGFVGPLTANQARAVPAGFIGPVLPDQPRETTVSPGFVGPLSPGQTRAAGPAVVTYHDTQTISMHGVTIQTADPVDLGRQLADAAARANLSGDGVGAVSHRSGPQG